ncbi:MAG: fibronectin type III domain-containing protein [Candidatus Gracilibacteria bacterium]
MIKHFKKTAVVLLTLIPVSCSPPKVVDISIAPAAVRLEKIKDITEKSAIVSWISNTKEITYDVLVSPNASQLQVVYSGIKSTNVTINNLNKGTTYYFTVVGRTALGSTITAQNGPLSFTTAP